MADAPAAAQPGTSSTPAAVAPATAAPAVAATAAPASPAATKTTPETTTAPATESPKPAADPQAKQDATPPAEPASEPATVPDSPPAPLFTLPDDVKLDPAAASKLEAVLKGKLTPEGKVLLTGQELVDAFVDQARDAYTRWQQQVVDTDKANEAACKERFTPAQLSQAETAVGFFSSYDSAFRDFAKALLNNPIFVNAMRLVGERLSEDTFEIAGQQLAVAPKKSAAERMGYAKPKPN